MKYIKISILLSILCTIPFSIFTKNKEQIHFYNNYGDDVRIDIIWSAQYALGGFDRNDYTILHPNEQISLKAPFSSYKAESIDVTPVTEYEAAYTSIQDNFGDQTAFFDETETFKKPKHHDKIKAHGTHFFIINNRKHESLSKILIVRYNNEEKYKTAIETIEKTRN